MDVSNIRGLTSWRQLLDKEEMTNKSWPNKYGKYFTEDPESGTPKLNPMKLRMGTVFGMAIDPRQEEDDKIKEIIRQKLIAQAAREAEAEEAEAEAAAAAAAAAAGRPFSSGGRPLTSGSQRPFTSGSQRPLTSGSQSGALRPPSVGGPRPPLTPQGYR